VEKVAKNVILKNAKVCKQGPNRRKFAQSGHPDTNREIGTMNFRRKKKCRTKKCRTKKCRKLINRKNAERKNAERKNAEM
jgi:hypothetical protein